MNTRQKSLIIGALVGAGLGVVGGYLFSRGVDLPREEAETRGLARRTVPPGEMVKVFISIMGVLRGIAELGERI